jgi:hypothetical protein
MTYTQDIEAPIELGTNQRDHAANIAEDSFWHDQAIDIRHSHEPKK